MLCLISALCRLYTNEIDSAIRTLATLARATQGTSDIDEQSLVMHLAMCGCLSVAYRLNGDELAAERAAAKLPFAPPRSLGDVVSALRDGVSTQSILH